MIIALFIWTAVSIILIILLIKLLNNSNIKIIETKKKLSDVTNSLKDLQKIFNHSREVAKNAADKKDQISTGNYSDDFSNSLDILHDISAGKKSR